MVARHRRVALLALAAAAAGCRASSAAPPDADQRRAIADSLTTRIQAAYDLSKGDVVGRFMSLYPDSGRVVSASGGRVTTSRDSLQAGIQAFWEYIGKNMQGPRWQWGPSHVDVLSHDAAVVTTTYRIPHRTPDGAPHTIAGAWTAVFARRGGRWVIIQEHLSELPQEALAAQAGGAHDEHAGHERRP